MKYLFCTVWAEETHQGLDLCVVPLDPGYSAGVLKLTEAVAEFSENTPDVASVKFVDSTPRWYGSDVPFPWELLEPYVEGSSEPMSTTEMAVEEEGYAILELPDDFELPQGERTELERLVFFRNAHQLCWQCYLKHGDFLFEACAMSPSIVVNPTNTVPQPA